MAHRTVDRVAVGAAFAGAAAGFYLFGIRMERAMLRGIKRSAEGSTMGRATVDRLGSW